MQSDYLTSPLCAVQSSFEVLEEEGLGGLAPGDQPLWARGVVDAGWWAGECNLTSSRAGRPIAAGRGVLLLLCMVRLHSV